MMYDCPSAKFSKSKPKTGLILGEPRQGPRTAVFGSDIFRPFVGKSLLEFGWKPPGSFAMWISWDSYLKLTPGSMALRCCAVLNNSCAWCHRMPRVGGTRSSSCPGVDSPERGKEKAPGIWKRERSFLTGVREVRGDGDVSFRRRSLSWVFREWDVPFPCFPLKWPSIH